MRYLIDPNKNKSAAHLWGGSDTYCKMLSTGGMTRAKKEIFDTAMGKAICTMCVNNYLKKHGGMKTSGKL